MGIIFRHFKLGFFPLNLLIFLEHDIAVYAVVILLPFVFIQYCLTYDVIANSFHALWSPIKRFWKRLVDWKVKVRDKKGTAY